MRATAISSGHGLYVRGASGYLDEVNEARRVVDRVAAMLRGASASTAAFHDNVSRSQSENLKRITDWHNAQKRDLDVSVHFNAYQTTSKPMGVEVLYITQSALASELSAKIAGAGGFINRGGKKRTDLYFLNNTSKPAILIEVCFVDSRADADAYKAKFEEICTAIAEKIGDVTLKPGEPPQPEEPIDPEAPGPSDKNVADIAITTQGDVLVMINGQEIVAGPPENTVDLTVRVTGDAVVTVDGEDFQLTPPPAPIWQLDIETTVFKDDTTAYPPFGPITDTMLGVALPFKFVGARPQVAIRNRANGKQVVTDISDVGPWMIDDDYWIRNARPIAETCFIEKKPLPRGPHKGQIPRNAAGLDLTPAAAKAISLDGKGRCDWAFLPIVQDDAVA